MDVPAGIAINAHKAGLHRSPPLQASSRDGGHENKVQSDAVAFKDQLESCLVFFRSLIDAMVRSTKESAFAGHYFHPIIRRLDDDLVRIEIWAFDVGAYEPYFGRSAQATDIDLELTRYITTLLKDLRSLLEKSEEHVEKMRAVIEKMSGGRFRDLKSTRQLRTLLAQVDKECQKVALTIRNVVSLTEAFQMEQAIKLQNGPFAGLRQQHLEATGQITGLSWSSPTVAREEPQPGSTEVAASENLGPWSRKSLLSLDGGGTNCFSTLLILKALMVEIAVQEQNIWPQAYSSSSSLRLKPHAVKETKGKEQQSAGYIDKEGAELARYLPCQYFDYTIGTSFGGLIAIMLSRLRMNVEECLEDFQTLLDKVWSQRRFFHSRSPTFWLREKYANGTLEHAIKDMVERRSPDGNENTTLGQQNEDICRCIVAACYEDGKWIRHHFFRSYYPPFKKANDPDRKRLAQNLYSPNYYTIWEIIRATTARPTYFAPIKLGEGNNAIEYFDGGSVNPIMEGYTSARLESGKHPGLTLSIGSGARKAVPIDEVSHWMAVLSSQNSDHFTCLVGPEGLGDMPVDEWKGENGRDTLKIIREKTEDYLRSAEAKERLAEVARVLVKTRRERASTDHWERFCYGTEYVCTVINCKETGSIHKERLDLRRHLEAVHQIDSSSVETVLDEGRRFPLLL